MNVTEMKADAGWLMLRVPPKDAERAVQAFKAGEYTLTRKRQKRSLTANSYAWALMQKISEKVRRPVEDVYRTELEFVTGIREQILIHEDAVDAFTNAFIGDHDGRSVRRIGWDGEYVELLLVYGSSDFDTRQMSELIDAIIEDCRNLEIEYDNLQIKSLLSEMEEREKRLQRDT